MNFYGDENEPLLHLNNIYSVLSQYKGNKETLKKELASSRQLSLKVTLGGNHRQRDKMSYIEMEEADVAIVTWRRGL